MATFQEPSSTDSLSATPPPPPAIPDWRVFERFCFNWRGLQRFPLCSFLPFAARVLGSPISRDVGDRRARRAPQPSAYVLQPETSPPPSVLRCRYLNSVCEEELRREQQSRSNYSASFSVIRSANFSHLAVRRCPNSWGRVGFSLSADRC